MFNTLKTTPSKNISSTTPRRKRVKETVRYFVMNDHFTIKLTKQTLFRYILFVKTHNLIPYVAQLANKKSIPGIKLISNPGIL